MPNKHALYRWTPAKRDEFLTLLSESMNVTRSAEKVGLGFGSAYALRRIDAEFAADWQGAIAAAYERIEAALVEDALGLRDPNLPALERDFAMRMLSIHRAMAQGRPSTRRPLPIRRASREEVEAAILKKIAVIRQRVERAETKRRAGRA